MYTPISFLGINDPFSSLSHLIATVAFIFLNAILFYHGRGNALRVTALVIYGITIIFLLSMSGVYHLLEDGSTARHVLRRMDHAGIWMLIAGTFTPIHVIMMSGFWRWGILVIVWVTAITGMVLEVVFFRDFPEELSLMFYLSLGWLGIVSAITYRKSHPGRSIKYMMIGGLSYSIGAIFDYFRWPIIINGVFAYHEIFHLAVVIGISCHWMFIYQIADIAITKRLTLLIKERTDETMATYYFVSCKTENVRFFAYSEPELFEMIHVAVRDHYHHYRRPKSVRLQYIKEQFIDPIPKQKNLVSSERFYKS